MSEPEREPIIAAIDRAERAVAEQLVAAVSDPEEMGKLLALATSDVTAGRVGDLKPLIGHRVVDLEGLADDQVAQLSVVERRSASLREIGHGLAVRRLGVHVRRRRVPDQESPGALLHGRRHVARRRHPSFLAS